MISNETLTRVEILSINQILSYLKRSAEAFFEDKSIDFSNICQWLKDINSDSLNPLATNTCLFTLQHRIDVLSPQLLLRKNGGYLFLQVKTDAGRVIIDYGYASIDSFPQDNVLHSLLEKQNSLEENSRHEISLELLKFFIIKLLSSELSEALRKCMEEMLVEIENNNLEPRKWIGEIMSMADELIPHPTQEEGMIFEKISGILSQMI